MISSKKERKEREKHYKEMVLKYSCIRDTWRTSLNTLLGATCKVSDSEAWDEARDLAFLTSSLMLLAWRLDFENHRCKEICQDSAVTYGEWI